MFDILMSFAAGVLVTYYGWAPVPVGANHLYWVEWSRKWGRMMRIVGPMIIAGAVLQMLLK